MTEETVNAERLIRIDEVCQRVGLGKSTVYVMMRDGRFPKPYKISFGAVRWSEEEIAAWIADVKDLPEGQCWKT